MSIQSIAHQVDRSLLRILRAVSVTVYTHHCECRHRLLVQGLTISGRQLQHEVFIDEMAAEDREYANYIVRDAVQSVVYHLVETNPKEFF